jgi:SNF2 family DNA or RNA helicase
LVESFSLAGNAVLQNLPTPLVQHQLSALNISVGKRVFALFDEQGLGKTATLLATAALLYQRQMISGVLIVAPNDVHVQWIVEQLPKHWPAGLPVQAGYWRTGLGKKGYAKLMGLTELGAAAQGCPILSVNYDALSSPRAFALCKAMLTNGKAMLIADESHYIKTPAAMRTRLMQRLAPLAYVRRIATGTPAENPFDYYSQMRFLNPGIWGLRKDEKGREHPISKLEFKHRFAEFETAYVHQNGERREYEELLAYKNLDQLANTIAPYMLRRTKDECLDLPPKIYTRVPVSLSPKQASAYAELKERGMLLLQRAEAGEPVSIRELGSVPENELAELLAASPQANVVLPKIKLTMLLRLQQIVGGHVTDNAGRICLLEESFPRLTRTLEIINGVIKATGVEASARFGTGDDANERTDAANGHAATAGQRSNGVPPRSAKAIVWAQRTAELQLLARHIAAVHGPAACAIYDGSTPTDERLHLRQEFAKADSRLRILCTNPQTAGTGLNLTAATTALYYTNGYSFIQRQQSEDRIHRIGTTGTVNVYDFCARGVGVDESVLSILRDKQHLANAIFKTTTAQWREML